MATDWDAAHAKVGTEYGMKVREEQQAVIDRKKLEEIAIETALNFDPLEHKTLDELDELEDEEEERLFEEYRKKRMAEMQAIAKKEFFGDVREISKPQYEVEVTNASVDCCVVLHMYQNGIAESQLVTAAMEQLAPKYKHVKFLKIVSTRCVENYPDTNVPTILIYNEGDIAEQIIRLGKMGGLKFTADDLEWKLRELGVVKSDLEENPQEKLKRAPAKNYVNRTTRHQKDDSSEDDLSD